MILNIEQSPVPMKLVFELSEELMGNPNRISITQALTLNASKPRLGLRGVHGLFGSEVWWSNIRNGIIPLARVSGVITRAFFAGQGEEGPNNMIDLKMENSNVETVGIYVNREEDISLFKPGARVEVVYALDELKVQPAQDGGVNYSRVALEMAVSV
jgi:hypothetical protein